MIKKRDACLDTRAHTHTIALHKEIVDLKNIDLLLASNKDIELLQGVYGNPPRV